MTLKTLVLIVSLISIFSVAQAEITRKRTTTVTEKEENIQEDESPTNAELPKESEITAKFGSKATSGMSGCKTEELSQKLVRDLKSDCSAWLKDRKAELKGKYLTGSCDESCDDCGMHLQRCSVNGVVRYTIKTVN